jgi:hypothetical protein
MGYQVMMIRGSAATPVSAIAVGTLLVSGIVETLADDAPLDGKVTIAIDGQALVYGPADRAMIHYDIMTSATTQSVTFVMIHLPIAQSETHVADYIV